MKILLVEPPSLTLNPTEGSRQVQPLGLGYIAAALSPDHDVLQLIPDIRPNPDGADRLQETAATIRDESPDLVGISALSTNFPTARRIAALCRKDLGSDVPIVLGGLHGTLDPSAAAATGDFDYIVEGEGEEAIRELVAALEAGRDPAGIPGLASLGPTRTSHLDLDMLAFPRRDGILWEEDIQLPFYQSIITIRGCPYHCEYCSIPAIPGRVRHRSTENVAEEIEFLRERYDIPYLFYHDSVFTLSKKRTLALCHLLVARELTVPYSCQTRIDHIDPELLDAMQAAACEQIFFGIESGHEETLTRIHKHMPPERIRNTVKEVRARGIRCSAFFMVGFPWETREHIERTADFAMDLDLDALCLFSATPLPGSGLFHTTGEPPLPEDIDYRTPGAIRNFTALPDAEYADLYRSVWDRFEAYNLARITARPRIRSGSPG